MHSKIICLLILALVCVSAQDQSQDYRCTHDDKVRGEPELIDMPEDNFPPSQDDNGRLLSSSYPNIRMYGYYGLMAASSFKTYLEVELVPACLAYFQGALRVKYPVSGGVKLPSTVTQICGDSTPSVLHSGVSADYVHSFTTESDSGSWVADSSVCFSASGSHRPLIGKTILNTNLFKNPGSDILLHEKNTYLVLHEMTHTLGFSTSLYSSFIDSNGNLLTGHVKTATLDGATSTVVDVSPLTSKLRSFFGCSSLKGAYMENSGSAATAGSHFERRQFVPEVMTSGLIYQQSYSEFTLAMLEGTGWYSPDYTYADPYWFGQGQGCNFLLESCTASGFSYEGFCTGSYRGCTNTGRGGGICGTDIRSDNCKFQYPNVDYDCDSTAAESYARLPGIQAFGRTEYSKCFEGTLSSSSSTSATSFCFKYNCVSSTHLEVQVGSQTLTCTHEGSMSVSGYKGYITCPDPETFCSTVGLAVCPRNCMGRGNCVSGRCECYSGFTGKDCGLNA